MENDLVGLVLALAGLFFLTVSIGANLPPEQYLISPTVWIGFILIGIGIHVSRRK